MNFKVQKNQESIQVMVRVKPFFDNDQSNHIKIDVNEDENTILLHSPKNQSEAKSFTFDKIFREDSNQS